jgi:pyridoxamine 5'-phosphate oxidase
MDPLGILPHGTRVDAMSEESGADIAALRREYADGGLTEAALTPDPLAMFDRWFAEAHAAGLYEPNAMVVSTASDDGTPSSRMVLLKGVSEAGFVFYTNLGSRKGRELAANPRCSLLFPWHPLERQVRVEGPATALPPEDVAAYFATRPRGAQLGAHASQQSRPVADRGELEAAYDDAAARFADRAVPVPDEWGGYRVRPEVVEFWQGRPGRMHDRLVYHRGPAGWRVERLAP